MALELPGGVVQGAYWEGSTGQGTRRRESEEDSGEWFPQYLSSRVVVSTGQGGICGRLAGVTYWEDERWELAQWRRLLGSQKWQRPGGGGGGCGAGTPFAGGRSIAGGGGGGGVGREKSNLLRTQQEGLAEGSARVRGPVSPVNSDRP